MKESRKLYAILVPKVFVENCRGAVIEVDEYFNSISAPILYGLPDLRLELVDMNHDKVWSNINLKRFHNFCRDSSMHVGLLKDTAGVWQCWLREGACSARSYCESLKVINDR